MYQQEDLACSYQYPKWKSFFQRLAVSYSTSFQIIECLVDGNARQSEAVSSANFLYSKLSSIRRPAVKSFPDSKMTPVILCISRQSEVKFLFRQIKGMPEIIQKHIRKHSLTSTRNNIHTGQNHILFYRPQCYCCLQEPDLAMPLVRSALTNGDHCRTASRKHEFSHWLSLCRGLGDAIKYTTS